MRFKFFGLAASVVALVFLTACGDKASKSATAPAPTPAPPSSTNYNIIPDDAFLTPSITLTAFVKAFSKSAGADRETTLELQPCETRDIANKPLQAFSCKGETFFVHGVMGKDGRLKDVTLNYYVTDSASVHSMQHAASYLIYAITHRTDRIAIAADLVHAAFQSQNKFVDAGIDGVHLSALSESPEKYIFSAFPISPTPGG